jgi:soluble lytic murein transglycosylase-like protein
MNKKYFSSLATCIVLILLSGSGSLLVAQRKVSARRDSKNSILTATPASDSTAQKGEPIGKRIIFADGATLDVDDSWKQGDTIWYRRNGTSQSLDREVRSIETRFKEASTSNKLTGAPTLAASKVPAAAPVTWIYLVDGARFRVDEVREVADGAWYNRGKLAIFLDKERIARIEREQPDAAVEQWKGSGWSSGSALIDQLIRQNGTRFGIDPYLVFLVIEQESHFHPGVVSPKGARGLMQLMPGTARRFGVSRPYDPADNIRGGTQYLKELMTMFGGRVDLALASYNAGEGRVLDYGNRVPPFKETREYVKRISARYRPHVDSEGTGPVVTTPRPR